MYKQIFVKEFKNDDSIVIESQSLSVLQLGLNSHNFIVKLHAAPLLPLDLLKLKGEIAQVKTPFTPGSEGSGTIVECQNKSFLIGQKVSFTHPQGTFREYALVNEDTAIFQNEDTDLDSASCGFVNPMASLGLIQTALQYKAKGVVNLAASGAVGKMINDLAKVNGLNCLNIIRGDQSLMNEIKSTYKNDNIITLDQDAHTFQQQVKEYSEKLNATVCFDPIGGLVSGQVFNNLPQNSTLINYGSLSGKDIEGINGVQVRWGNKKLEGFSNFTWFSQLSQEEKLKQKKIISQYQNTIFKVSIEKQYSFDQIKAALTFMRGLKGGKRVIIKPFL